VTDTAGKSSQATQQVTISAADAPPAAALSVSPTSGAINLSVTANASASTDTDATPIASYSFNFGDGSAVVGPQPGATATHTYTSPGTYTVTVTVRDTAGLASTATSTVTVVDLKPTASLSLQPSSGPTPLIVTADASGSTDTDATPISTYSFDFGDGSSVGPQSAATASHTYTVAGTYTVTVTATDTAGQIGRATATVVVKTNFVLNPGFETNLSGWNTSGSDAGIVLDRVAGGHTGGWTARLTNPGTVTANCTLNDSPNWVTATSSPTPYVGSIWARVDSGAPTLKLRFREYSGSTLVGTATTLAALSTSWKQVSVTYTPLSPGASTLDFNAYVSTAAPGVCFYADDAAIYAP
jgi:PKD repeat protein